MIRKFAVSLALATAASAAIASDLPNMKGPAPAPSPYTPLPVSNWTGFYVGVNLGAEIVDNKWRTVNFGVPPGALPAPALANSSLSKTGFYFGAFAGYNQQISSNFVLGGEALLGFNTGGKKANVGTLPGRAIVATAVDSLSSNANWDGALRARLGFLVTPQWMIYGAGGLAWQNVNYSSTCTNAPSGGSCVAPRTDSHDALRVGWTLGGGVEGHISGHWLARLDYRYSDFGSANHQFFTATPVDQWGGAARLRTQVVTVGLGSQF